MQTPRSTSPLKGSTPVILFYGIYFWPTNPKIVLQASLCHIMLILREMRAPKNLISG